PGRRDAFPTLTPSSPRLMPVTLGIWHRLRQSGMPIANSITRWLHSLQLPRMNEQLPSPAITRRDALKAVAGAGLAASLSGCASLTGGASRRDLVRREN